MLGEMKIPHEVQQIPTPETAGFSIIINDLRQVQNRINDIKLKNPRQIRFDLLNILNLLLQEKSRHQEKERNTQPCQHMYYKVIECFIDVLHRCQMERHDPYCKQQAKKSTVINSVFSSNLLVVVLILSSIYFFTPIFSPHSPCGSLHPV